MHNTNHGFSLLELLLVITLISLLCFLTIPSYKSLINQANEQITSSQLLRAISLAKSEALLRNQTITLCASTNSKSCSSNWSEGYIIKTDEDVLFVFHNQLSGILNWRAFPLRHHALQFLPNGYPNADNATFWYCENKQSIPAWAIVINQLGRTKLLFPNARGEIFDSNNKRLNCI